MYILASFVEDKMSIYVWIYLWAFYFVPLIYISVKVKRQPSEWEKIIAKEATDKNLISKIYKQLLQLNSRKIKYMDSTTISGRDWLVGPQTLPFLLDTPYAFFSSLPCNQL